MWSWECYLKVEFSKYKFFYSKDSNREITLKKKIFQLILINLYR